MVQYLGLSYPTPFHNALPVKLEESIHPLCLQYTNIACNFKGHVTKVDGGYSVYGSTPANIIMKDVWMEGVSVQGIDRVLLPGDINAAPECLQQPPLV